MFLLYLDDIAVSAVTPLVGCVEGHLAILLQQSLSLSWRSLGRQLTLLNWKMGTVDQVRVCDCVVSFR